MAIAPTHEEMKTNGKRRTHGNVRNAHLRKMQLARTHFRNSFLVDRIRRIERCLVEWMGPLRSIYARLGIKQLDENVTLFHNGVTLKEGTPLLFYCRVLFSP